MVEMMETGVETSVGIRRALNERRGGTAGEEKAATCSDDDIDREVRRRQTGHEALPHSRGRWPFQSFE